MPWFRALRKAIQVPTDNAKRLRLVLVGSNTFEGRSLASLAVQCGVDAHVRVMGNQCHQTTLSIMAGADALALAGATGPGAHLQVPNKLFECLALRRPIIAAIAEGSPVRAILEAADARAAVCVPSDVASLSRALTALAAHGDAAWNGTWAGVDQFDRTHTAKQLLDLFERITEGRHTSVVKRSSVLQRAALPSINAATGSMREVPARQRTCHARDPMVV